MSSSAPSSPFKLRKPSFRVQVEASVLDQPALPGAASSAARCLSFDAPSTTVRHPTTPSRSYHHWSEYEFAAFVSVFNGIVMRGEPVAHKHKDIEKLARELFPFHPLEVARNILYDQWQNTHKTKSRQLSGHETDCCLRDAVANVARVAGLNASTIIDASTFTPAMWARVGESMQPARLGKLCKRRWQELVDFDRASHCKITEQDLSVANTLASLALVTNAKPEQPSEGDDALSRLPGRLTSAMHDLHTAYLEGSDVFTFYRYAQSTLDQIDRWLQGLPTSHACHLAVAEGVCNALNHCWKMLVAYWAANHTGNEEQDTWFVTSLQPLHAQLAQRWNGLAAAAAATTLPVSIAALCQ